MHKLNDNPRCNYWFSYTRASRLLHERGVIADSMDLAMAFTMFEFWHMRDVRRFESVVFPDPEDRSREWWDQHEFLYAAAILYCHLFDFDEFMDLAEGGIPVEDIVRGVFSVE